MTVLRCRYLLPHHPEVSTKGHKGCKNKAKWDAMFVPKINEKGEKIKALSTQQVKKRSEWKAWKQEQQLQQQPPQQQQQQLAVPAVPPAAATDAELGAEPEPAAAGSEMDV